MKLTDWYSRLLLTAIVGLLFYNAVKLTAIEQLYASTIQSQGLMKASPDDYSAMPASYRLQAGNLAQSGGVVNVRLVGLQYESLGGKRDVPFSYSVNNEASYGIPVWVRNPVTVKK